MATNLSNFPCRLKWYQEAEKTNGRWAMMAVAGILGTELIGKPAWYLAGAQEYDLPVIAQVPILFLVMGFLETKRYQGFKETGTVSVTHMVHEHARCTDTCVPSRLLWTGHALYNSQRQQI